MRVPGPDPGKTWREKTWRYGFRLLDPNVWVRLRAYRDRKTPA